MRAATRLLWTVAAVGSIWAAAHWVPAASADAADAVDPPTPAMIEAQTCGECHEDQLTSAHRGPHAAIDRDPELAALRGVSSSCAGCHGDPTEHLETTEPESMFRFGDDQPAALQSSRCLDCHAGSHPRFLASPHAAAGLDCTSCHVIHGDSAGALLASKPQSALHALDTASSTCTSCHGSVLAQFEFNERHRLQEGIIGCTDCHDPHAPNPRRLLGGFKQQQCAGCHVDKAGPFVFEHGSSRIEGCVACHEPHGAPSRHQLRFQSVADMCYSCHAAVPGFHTRFTSETVCTNCHSTIHGSNFHPAFLQ